MKWLLFLVTLTSCEISCKDLPVQHDVVVLPVSVERPADAKCRDELEYYRSLIEYYRDHYCD